MIGDDSEGNIVIYILPGVIKCIFRVTICVFSIFVAGHASAGGSASTDSLFPGKYPSHSTNDFWAAPMRECVSVGRLSILSKECWTQSMLFSFKKEDHVCFHLSMPSTLYFERASPSNLIAFSSKLYCNLPFGS